MMKRFFLFSVAVLWVVAAQAEPIRTVVTKENRLPRVNEWEASLIFDYIERETQDETAIAPYLRYGLLRDLAAFATVPYRSIEDDLTDNKESGFGDVSLGFEWVVYRNLFGAPWIMPHAEVILDNGNEEKGLGTGSTDYVVGLAAGTTVQRDFHFTVDARYRIVDDQDNIPSIAGSLVWDLDRRLSLISEIEVSREKEDELGLGKDTHPILFWAGMHYRARRDLQFSIHAGTSKNTDIDAMIRARVTKAF